MSWKRRLGIGVIAVSLAAALVFLFRDRILWSLGAVLSRSEPPQKSEAIVVLGGDSRGERILLAAELARQGYAPKVLVSGGEPAYGKLETDLAVDYAVAHGYPREEFIKVPGTPHSTREEAAADIGELRRRGIHKYLLVTSVYHTARAGRIFERYGRGLEVHLIAARDADWLQGRWWTTREGRKVWLTEALKTVADYLGI